MARRVIATAEVQVQSDITRAEAGLQDLTTAFRQVGAMAERAAERAEAAFFGASGNIQGSYRKILAANDELLNSISRTDAKAQMMADTFREALTAIRAMGTEDGYEQKAIEALRVYKELYQVTQLIEAGLHDDAKAAQRVADAAREAARQTQEIENATLEAQRRAYMLSEAFKDVGQDIDLAMAGGLDQLQDDIRQTIRRLADMGDKGFDVARHMERSFDGILSEFDNDVDGAVASLFRLQRAGEGALDSLESDARQAASALNDMGVQARQADRSIDSIGSVARRTSGDIRGLVGLLGAAGIGYAAASAARAGLDMTLQLEKSRAMFLGLTGSVEGAADMLERMVVFARETPYNLANVSDAAAQLLAVGDGFGVTTGNIEEYLTAFGNAITMTGGGDEQFTRIVRVFGQMSSSGKVLGQDMNQLAQNLPGYDVWQALADGAGTSVTELRRLQDLGQLDNLLTGNQAVEILVAGMEKIPGAAGAMERRMNTLGGAIEKFRETAQFAMSKGLVPFSETAQDVLSDPVILNSVEDLSFAFGDLLSTALQDVRPELDDLAVAGENLLGAFESWTPVLTQIVDGLGDVVNVVSALIGPLGKAASSVLEFGDGLGKMGLAAAAFAAGGPVGIAAGVVLGVSGAMDFFGGSAEVAANSARLLAAAQGEVNAAMAVGEEAIYSEAQQAAITAAEDIAANYPELARVMNDYGVTIAELNSGFEVMAGKAGTLTPELQALIASFTEYPDPGNKVMTQLETLQKAYENETDVLTTETAERKQVLAIAGADQIAADEERQASLEAYGVALQTWSENYGDFYRKMVDDQAAANEEWGQLDEEQVESVREMLDQQVEAYRDWEAGINESTDGAAISMSGLADEYDNNVQAMIDAINENSVATANWKNNIVYAAGGIQNALGLTDEEAQNFMGTLGNLGVESAPALQAMLDDFAAGGTQLQDFFNATKTNADVMATDLTTSFDTATGSVPSLAESLAEGTLTVEQVLAEIPAAMEQAGIDFEEAATMIDASDEMGTVGDEAVSGLVTALTNSTNLSKVRVAATDLGSIVAQATAIALAVSSPSRVMFDIGEFVVEGLVDGIQSMSDEAYDEAVQVASLISGGIEEHFKDAEKPQEEARKFAEDVAEAIIDELIAEQEAVADAAEALAEAAADRLAEAWDRVKDRFKNRDIQEGVAEALAELNEARAELAAAESLAGAGGTAAMAAAEARVREAQAALATARAADEQADLLAEQVLTNFQRGAEDAVTALQKQQESEIATIQGRIAAATRNLDPVARAAAEAELAAAEERHEAEMTALERRNQDEEEALQRRLDNENTIREATIDARQDELDAFEDALDDIVKSITDAIENLPELRAGIGDAERDVQDAYFDQFEQMLENVSSVDRNLLASIGAKAGLTSTEVSDLIESAIASESASAGAAAANLGVDQLLNVLGSGLYTIGADGALGIAAGISDQARAIAEAMFDSVQYAIRATLYSLGIKSPSKVTEEMIGTPMALGIAEGIMNSVPEVNSAMAGLIDNVMGGVSVPSSSQLVDNGYGATGVPGVFGPLVTMPGAIIQDATDADLVAQRVAVALSATGSY
jgi:tape measure domain-containing protein